MKHRWIIVGLVAACVAAPACAQWMWKDDAGKTVISDQPPPPTVPKSHVLKEGRFAAPSPAHGSAGNAEAQAQPKSAAELNADFEKRRKEKADSDAKSAKEADASKQKQAACAAAQSTVNTLSSGQRVATYDAQGQRTFMDDAARKKSMEQAQMSAAENCK